MFSPTNRLVSEMLCVGLFLASIQLHALITAANKISDILKLEDSLELTRSPVVENVLFLLKSSSPDSVYVIFERKTAYLVASLALRLSSTSTSVVLLETHSSEEVGSIYDLVSQNLIYEYEQHVVLLLDSPEMVLGLFHQVKDQALESPRLRWYLPMLSQETLGPLEALLREGSWVAVSVRRQDTFDIFSTRIDVNGSAKLVPLGFHSPQRDTADSPRHRYLRDKLFPDLENYYRDFQGRTVIAPAVFNAPWYDVAFPEDGSDPIISGIDVDILDVLSSLLNFTYKVVYPPDGAWGGPLPDGTVTGMIGMVARHEADFAIDAFTVTPQRETVVDFSYPYYIAGTTFISRAPEEKNRALAILRPFTLPVWLSLLAITAVAGLLVFIVSLLANLAEGFGVSSLKVCGNGIDQEVPLSVGLVFRYAFNFFRCIVNQGNQLEPLQAAPRIVSLAWYFFCLNIYIVYSGILTSFLTLPAFEEPIDSLADLYVASQERGYLLGLLKDSSQEYLFKFAESGIYADLWKTVTKRNYERNVDESLKRMMNKEPFTYTGDDVTLIMSSALYGLSNFHIAKETFYPQPFGIALRSGSPYKETFSRVLMRLQESGLINRWIKDVLENAANSQGTETSTDSTEGDLPILSLLHLQSALILYAGGVIVAFLIFIGEIVTHARHREQPHSIY